MSVLAWSLVWAAATIAALALTLAAAGYWILQRKLAAMSSECETAKMLLGTQLEPLTREIFDCRRRLTELDSRYTAVAEQPQVPASLHLNRRGQVLHLYRRGESPRKIAAALGMSQGEVKLIIKVVELGADNEAVKLRNNLNRKRSTTLDKSSGPQKGEA